MTRIEESRNSQLRENETREETEYVFEEPNATHIPRGVEERFNQQDMSLGWLRILLMVRTITKKLVRSNHKDGNLLLLMKYPKWEQLLS